MIEISSNTNEHYRRWMDLAQSRGIKKHGEFILMGDKLIAEFLKNPTFKIKGEIICEGMTPLTPALQTQLGRVSLFKLPKALFNEVDVIGTHYNLLVLETKPLEALDPKSTAQGLEIVCPLGDPSNLGAIARSALAFDVKRLILTEESCTPYHPKAIKASAGALLSLPLVKTIKLPDFVAQNEGIYALDMKGENVASFKWPKNLRLVVGEEGPGFSGIRGLQRLSVPTGSIESLNATVAASIAMFCYANS